MAEKDPLCVTDVRAAMGTIGLEPVGSAVLMQNYDTLVLGRIVREAIHDDNARELARDFLIDQFFHRDVFARNGRRLEEEERRQRPLASTFMLARPAPLIEYAVTTPAGQVKFDNAVARSIVAALAAGPMPLAEIAAKSAIEAQDVLVNALVLCAADALQPVERSRTEVIGLNQAICRRLAGVDEIQHLVLPWDTAQPINKVLRGILQNGKQSDQHEEWLNFIDALSVGATTKNTPGAERAACGIH